MLASTIHETNSAPIDFRPQLQSAFEHATPHAPEDPLGNDEIASRYTNKPDDYVIALLDAPGPNQVTTTDPTQYRHLLLQAAELLNDGNQPSEEMLARIEDAAAHEERHGEIAAQFGNSDTVSHYGLATFIDTDGRPNFWPYHIVVGPLKKVHQAWVAVGLEDRSDIDIAVAQNLGYTDIEDLRRKALDEPSVAEGWQMPTMRERLLDASRDSD